MIRKAAHHSQPMGDDRLRTQLNVRYHERYAILQLNNIAFPASMPSTNFGTMKRWEVNMRKSGSDEGQSASDLIDNRIAELGDWRGETLKKMRGLIKELKSTEFSG